VSHDVLLRFCRFFRRATFSCVITACRCFIGKLSRSYRERRLRYSNGLPSTRFVTLEVFLKRGLMCEFATRKFDSRWRTNSLTHRQFPWLVCFPMNRRVVKRTIGSCRSVRRPRARHLWREFLRVVILITGGTVNFPNRFLVFCLFAFGMWFHLMRDVGIFIRRVGVESPGIEFDGVRFDGSNGFVGGKLSVCVFVFGEHASSLWFVLELGVVNATVTSTNANLAYTQQTRRFASSHFTFDQDQQHALKLLVCHLSNDMFSNSFVGVELPTTLTGQRR